MASPRFLLAALLALGLTPRGVDARAASPAEDPDSVPGGRPSPAPTPARPKAAPPAATPSPSPAAAPAAAGVEAKQTRLLPIAFAHAASEARREAAAAHRGLQAGPEGQIDLALSTLIDLTLRNNLDLLIASYAPALSAEQQRAREAIYDPLLAFTFSLLSSNNPATSSLAGAAVVSRDSAVWNLEVREQTPLGGSVSLGFANSRDKSNSQFASPNPAFNSSFTFDVAQPLLRNFGRSVTEREIRIARNDRAASRHGFRDQVQAKVTEAIDAYWVLYGAIENLEVQGAALGLAEELRNMNRTRVQVGTMAPLDISFAEAEVKRNEEQVISAEEARKLAEDRIRQLVNLPADSPLWQSSIHPVDAPVIAERKIDVESAIRTAIDRRADILRQELQVENARIRREYARNQTLPALNLTASYGLAGVGGTEIVREGGPFGSGEVTRIPGGYGDALDQLTSFDFDTWRLGLNFELPLFNKAARANRAAASLGHLAERDRLELVKQAVSLEVRRLARRVETSVKRIEAAGSSHKLQVERLSAERKKYEHGLSTNFEVQQAQKDLTSARVSEVVARTDYLKAVAELERAMGTVLEAHGVQVQE